MSIDEKINEVFEPIADSVGGIVFYSVNIMDQDIKLILVWLVLAAIFFTFYLGFINFRYFMHAFDLVSGKEDDIEEEAEDPSDGQITRFQALMTSLSGTVGLGNIAGVAVAVSLGGPGAMVWMILMGLFSMSTKFAEVALAVKYRKHMTADHPEEISGGPMYYLKEAFVKLKMPAVGTVIAVIFAICCVGGSLGGGNMFQANQAYTQVVNVTSGNFQTFLIENGWVFGLALAILVGLVIIGGIQSIARVTSKLVPVMGGIYMAAGLVVIGMYSSNIPAAFGIIIDSAFSMQAGIGGLLGAILLGVQRAAFSNEAGLGSAAIVHSTARTKDHVSQGIVSMLGPFIDTIVICTVTALVIVITGAYENVDGVGGVELTSQAFAKGLSWFPYVLALTVFLFAYSTLITWSYYGLKAVTYLFGENDMLQLLFKLFFCCFVVIGCTMDLKSVIDFSDAMILSMGIPNIIGLYIFAPELRRDVKAYAEKLKSKKSEA